MSWFSSTKGDLFKAAKRGDLAGIRAAIAAGADVNAKSALGDDTALMLAAEHGQVEAVHELLRAGADLHRRDVLGRDALARAAIKANAAMVTELIRAGANPNGCSSDGRNAFLFMLDAPFFTLAPGHVDVTKALLAGGMDPSATDGAGNSMLLVAVRYGYDALFNTLLEAGATPNQKSKDLVTPLVMAAVLGNGAHVKALIAAGADVSVGGEGVTLLMLAAGFVSGRLVKLGKVRGDAPERVEAVQALIAAGADVNARTPEGATALMFAAESGRAQVVKALIAAGAELDAVMSGIGAVIEYGGGVTKHEHRNCTALMLAAVKGKKEAALALVEAGANVDVRTDLDADLLTLARVGSVFTSVALQEAIEKRKKQA